MEIGETLRRALAKLVMRAAGDQLKTTCGNLQMCAGLKAGLEGATHAVRQRRFERTRMRRSVEDAGYVEEEEGETVSVGVEFNNLSIETVGI